jgi:hypothetical protein
VLIGFDSKFKGIQIFFENEFGKLIWKKKSKFISIPSPSPFWPAGPPARLPLPPSLPSPPTHSPPPSHLSLLGLGPSSYACAPLPRLGQPKPQPQPPPPLPSLSAADQPDPHVSATSHLPHCTRSRRNRRPRPRSESWERPPCPPLHLRLYKGECGPRRRSPCCPRSILPHSRTREPPPCPSDLPSSGAAVSPPPPLFFILGDLTLTSSSSPCLYFCEPWSPELSSSHAGKFLLPAMAPTASDMFLGRIKGSCEVAFTPASSRWPWISKPWPVGP